MVYPPYGPALFGDLGWQDVATRTVGALIFTYTILGVPYSYSMMAPKPYSHYLRLLCSNIIDLCS